MKPIMSNQVLLRFLQAGLLNLNGDDAKLAKLQEAAEDLAKILQKTPGKTASFALIAFDPQAPINDPVTAEVIAVLQNRWATYVNTFAGTPMMVIRAILLEAIVQASDDEKVGVAFVASARNVLPFMEAANEQAIWADVVAECEKRVDARAELEWATPESIKVPAMQPVTQSPIKLSTAPISIDHQDLETQLQAAAGPQTTSGPTNGNPYASPHSQNPQWATEFGTRAATAITTALETALEESGTESIDLSEPLIQLSQAVTKYVETTLKSVSAATSGLQRRTNLIWWKETLYSPSARVSYRGLPKPTAAALLAFDLYQQVPTFSPASVVAFLHEMVLSLPDIDPAQQLSIRDLFGVAVTSPELGHLRDIAAQMVPDNGGRGLVLGLLGLEGAHLSLNDESFRDRIGIPAATMLTLPEWAAWLFRELQAAEATQNLAKPKRRGS